MCPRYTDEDEVNIQEMISVCIPIHNNNVVTLVDGLLQQAAAENIEIEIIVFDDLSQASYRAFNEQLRELPHVFYLPLIENLGRSRIRNRMADMAQGEWLLFLDGDMSLLNDNFLRAYNDVSQGEDDVVCGGVFYGSKPADILYQLQWRMCQQMLRHRSRISRRGIYEHVSTGNFMIRKRVFSLIKFDESITTYGQEDQLFSLQLHNKQHTVRWINNPLKHDGQEQNSIYIQKIETSLQNLVRSWNALPLYHDLLQRSSKRIRVALFLRRMSIDRLFRFFFRVFGKRIRRACERGKVAMWLFSFYQMGYLLELFRVPNLKNYRPR